MYFTVQIAHDNTEKVHDYKTIDFTELKKETKEKE
jgi:hypothetical protein